MSHEKYTTPDKPEESELPKVSPTDDDANKKSVQFTADTHDTKHNTQTAQKRGLVSRRGGRFVSPGRRQENLKDEVPSLCSTNSQDLLSPARTTNRTMTPPPNRDPKKPPKTPDELKASPGSGLFLGSPTAAFNDESKFLDSKPSPRFISTPTDFALDYGRHQSTPGSLDTSNVLAWLQSPTAHGLFSPGPSVSNTPRKQPTTPRTPTVSTSFFFSDVANLPQDGAPEGATPLRSARRGGNIICISPLASKAQEGNQKDIFSPQQPPDVGETPDRHPRLKQRSGSMDPSLDAAMAERDLMEDEDLSVLIKLASTHTPRGRGRGGAESTTPGRQGSLPSLQLPEIGHDEKNSTKPQINMRSNSKDKDDESKKTTGKARSEGGYTSSRTERAPHPHHAARYPPNYHHPSHPQFPSNHPYYATKPGYPGSMPPSGTMRISVGAPPPRPPASASKSVGYPQDYYPPMYSGYPSYPYPYHGPYPPPASARSARQALLEPDPDRPPSPPNAKKFSLAEKSPKVAAALKRSSPSPEPTTTTSRKRSRTASARKKRQQQELSSEEQEKTREAVQNLDGGRNTKAAELAAAILRGVTMRPSGKWQAQLYFSGKSRYIGVFDSREKAALAYEIAREKLKNGGNPVDPKNTDDLVNEARKAAFDGVNEKF